MIYEPLSHIVLHSMAPHQLEEENMDTSCPHSVLGGHSKCEVALFVLRYFSCGSDTQVEGKCLISWLSKVESRCAGSLKEQSTRK